MFHEHFTAVMPTYSSYNVNSSEHVIVSQIITVSYAIRGAQMCGEGFSALLQLSPVTVIELVRSVAENHVFVQPHDSNGVRRN